MKIIEATNNEVTDLVSLNYHVQTLHHKAHPELFKPPSNGKEIESYFDSILRENSTTILMAYLDSLAVGYAWYTDATTNDSPLTYSKRKLVIQHIAVHDEHRRKNIGSALLNEIKNRSIELSITQIVLDTWQFNTEAHVFFRAHGFETYNINMWFQSS